jgi:nucleoside-diphosphate-sugar epimerase
MEVLVTGGSGRLGQFAISELTAHGHDVVNADRYPAQGSGSASVRFVEADLTNVESVSGALEGCDAVVHLGAIPRAGSEPDHVVFANNTQATFSVLQSASLLGIQRAVIASSIAIYGEAYAADPTGPLYVPVDESHPLRVRDPYALSKEVDERVAAMFTRKTAMSVAALRFHWVGLPEELNRSSPAVEMDPAQLAPLLWGYVDARDAATACRLAIEADRSGFEVFNITAGDTLLDEPTEDLIRRYLPESETRASVPGRSTGYAIEKAARLIGWEPQHSWRS